MPARLAIVTQRDWITAYAVLPGPWGPIHAAAQEIASGCTPEIASGAREATGVSDDHDRAAIVALELMTPTGAFIASLERRSRGPVVPAAEGPATVRRLLVRARREVEAYLAGTRRSFDLPIDLVGLSEWDRLILDGVRRIPYGSVTSYGRLAQLVGRPGAARAVGGAVGRNPIGLVIPCHRVIAGDGSLGGYGGDWFGTREELLQIKRDLLDRERIELPAVAFVG